MNQVRWRIEVSKPGHNNWLHREDLMYSGWFHSTGVDKPPDVVLKEFKSAVEKYDWLDIRLVQETRGTHQKIVDVTLR